MHPWTETALQKEIEVLDTVTSFLLALGIEGSRISSVLIQGPAYERRLLVRDNEGYRRIVHRQWWFIPQGGPAVLRQEWLGGRVRADPRGPRTASAEARLAVLRAGIEAILKDCQQALHLADMLPRSLEVAGLEAATRIFIARLQFALETPPSIDAR